LHKDGVARDGVKLKMGLWMKRSIQCAHIMGRFKTYSVRVG